MNGQIIRIIANAGNAHYLMPSGQPMRSIYCLHMGEGYEEIRQNNRENHRWN